MTETSPFRPALIVGLVVAGLISFAAFIILLGWGEPHPEGEAARAVPSSTAATGFKGLMDLSGRFLTVEAVDEESDYDRYDLLVVPLHPGDERAEVERLLRRRSGQATLLILPKWMVVRDPTRPDWVRALGPWQAETAGRLMAPDATVEPLSATAQRVSEQHSYGLLDGLELPMPSSPQVIHGDTVDMLVGIPGEGALVAQLGGQPHFVVADPDLLNNHGLRRPEAARAAVELLARLMPNEHVSVVFAASGSAVLEAPPERNLLRSMFEPPFLAMTLALLIAAMLAGLHGAVRFGPATRAVRAIPFGKAALVENSAGLVRLARREVRVGGGYADLVRDEAGRRGAAPSHLQGEALEAYLDRFTKPGGTPFRTLAYDVRAARDRGELVATARALFRWKKDMIR